MDNCIQKAAQKGQQYQLLLAAQLTFTQQKSLVAVSSLDQLICRACFTISILYLALYCLEQIGSRYLTFCIHDGNLNGETAPMCMLDVQDLDTVVARKKRRSVNKTNVRPIGNASIEVLQKRRAEKPEQRKASREAALRYVSNVKNVQYVV